MTKKEKQLIKYIDCLLKDIQKNAIDREHRAAELSIGCPECQFRLLEMYLNAYRDIIEL